MSEIVDKDSVKHIGNLARLELSAEEVTRYQQDMAKFLGHVAELENVNTDGVGPLQTPMRLFEKYYVESPKLHSDEVRTSLSP